MYNFWRLFVGGLEYLIFMYRLMEAEYSVRHLLIHNCKTFAKLITKIGAVTRES